MKFILRLDMLLFLLLLEIGGAHGQLMNTMINWNIYQIDLMTCDTTLFLEPSVQLTLMTYAPNGELYGRSYSTGNLYLIDQQTGVCDLLAQVNPENTNIGEMVSNSENVLYFFSNPLVTYNTETGEINTYPNFDYGVLGATYANGKIYFITPAEGIFELNPSDPANSTLVYPFAFSLDNLYISDALGSFPVSCDSSSMYAAFTVGEDALEIHEINLEEQSFTVSCTFDFIIGALFSPLEYTPPPCYLSIDLDGNDSSALGYDYLADTSCISSGHPISDLDLAVLSEAGIIDSVFVFFASNPAPNSGEYFTSGSTLNLSTIGNNSPFLTITDTGNADVIDFENIIHSIQYHNDTSPFEEGYRRIGVVLWSQGNVSDTAWATIPFYDFTPSAGDDTSIELCINDLSIQLFEVLEGSPDSGGWWTPSTNNNGVFIPGEDASGTYQYIQNGYQDCPSDTAEITISVAAPSIFSLGNDTTLCSDHAFVLTPTITGQSYFWQDGSEGVTYEVTDPGLYWLEVENEQGCISSDSIMVTFGGVSESNENIHLCDGESYEHKGVLYQDDAIILENHTNILGCDSVHTVQLFFASPIQMTTSESICEGNTYFFGGLPFLSDTIICQTYQSIAGCDSTQCLELEVLPFPQINLGVDLDILEGMSLSLDAGTHEQYLWSNGSSNPILTINTGGLYSVTVTDDGCSSLDEILITSIEKNDYFAPNIFTPNDDGINDVFTIYAKPGTIIVEDLNIYNRWGGLVFKKEHFPAGVLSLGWDGTYKNHPASSDVYVFYANIIWFNGRKEKIMGEITLLR